MHSPINSWFLNLSKQLSRFAQAAGIIAYAGLQWLVLLRLLSIGGYSLAGGYALAQAVVAPAVGFFAFSMRPLWVSGAMGGVSASGVLAIRITTGLAALVTAAIVEVSLGMNLAFAVFCYVLINKFLDTVSDILAGVFDRQRRSATAGVLLVAKSALLSVVVLAGWVMRLSLTDTVATLLAAQVGIVSVEWRLSNAGRPSGLFALSHWLVVFPVATALYAALNSLVASLLGFLPRYLLELFASRETVGYFSVIFIPVMMVQMIATGLSQTHLHQLSAVTQAGKIRESLLASAPIALLLTGIHSCVTILSVAAALFARLGWESRRPLLVDVSVVLALSLPLTLRQFYSYLATSTGRMGAVFLTSLLFLVVQVALAPWAIRTGGIYGCVGLMSAAAVIQIGAYWWILHQPNLLPTQQDRLEIGS